MSAVEGGRDPRGYDAAARRFVGRALSVHRVEEVATELGSVLRDTLGAMRTLLIVSDDAGVARVVGGDVQNLGSLEPALERLALRAHAVRAQDLGPEDEALIRLLDALGCSVAIPLRHRGALIAVAAIDTPTASIGDDELRLLRRLGYGASIAVANAHLYVERQGRAQTRTQITLATAMQDALMPEERPIHRGAMVLRGIFRPATECGGDFWTWEDLGENKVLLAIGDVTGHGVSAAMLVAMAKGVALAMRTAQGASLDPAWFLRALNGTIYRAGKTRWLMTCFAMVVDVEKASMQCSNAGHPFPYVLGPRGLRPIVLRGNALGSAADCIYYSETRELMADDGLLLYSDGAIDIINPQGQAFGDKRFRRMLEEVHSLGIPRGERVPRILQGLTRYAEGTPLVDDVTLVELGRAQA